MNLLDVVSVCLYGIHRFHKEDLEERIVRDVSQRVFCQFCREQHSLEKERGKRETKAIAWLS